MRVDRPQPGRVPRAGEPSCSPPCRSRRDGGADSHEHATAKRAIGAASSEVGDDRLAHLDRQRQPIDARVLAMHHELSGAPVDVLNDRRATSPARNPSRASVISIAKSRRRDRRRPVTRGQQTRDLLGLQALRQRHQPPPARRRHRVIKRPLDVTLGMQEPQQRPQRLRRALRRAARLRRARRHHERDDRRPSSARTGPLPDPRTRSRTVGRSPHTPARTRQQATLDNEITLVTGEQLVHRPLACGTCRQAPRRPPRR